VFRALGGCDGPWPSPGGAPSEYLLSADYRVGCGGPGYRFLLAYSFLWALAYLLGLPLLLLLVLHRHRLDIKHLGATRVPVTGPLNGLRFLFEPYRPEAWFFPCIDLLRRLAFAALGSGLLLPPAATAPLLLQLLVSTAYDACLRYLCPYVSMGDLVLAEVGCWQVHLTILAALALRFWGSGKSPPPPALELAVVVVTTATAAWTLLQLVWEVSGRGSALLWSRRHDGGNTLLPPKPQPVAAAPQEVKEEEEEEKRKEVEDSEPISGGSVSGRV
jgi:hypothetical protein